MLPSVAMNLARRIDTWGGLVICAALFGLSQLRAAVVGGQRLPPMRATTPPVAGPAPFTPHRVLAIKFYGLGNMVMVLPAIRAVREAFPGVQVDFLTLAENAPLLERSRLIDRTIGVRAEHLGSLIQSLWQALWAIRRRRYDLVLDFEQFVKFSALVAFASGAPDRIGFNTDGQRRGWLYTVRVVYTDSEHMSRIFMRVVLPLGVRGSADPVPIATTAAEEARIDALLAEHGVEPARFPLIAVHVGSGANFYGIPLKRWPTEHFAALCDALTERYGAAVVLTGKGDEERALVAATRAHMRGPAIDACDRFTVTELLALLARCHLAVVNDTSVMHLAGAVGTPIVAFFGPTAPLHYGPRNPDDVVLYQDLYCSPCLTNYNLKVSRCTNPICVRTIGVDEVLKRIDARYLGSEAPLRPRLLARTTPPAPTGRAASC